MPPTNSICEIISNRVLLSKRIPLCEIRPWWNPTRRGVLEALIREMRARGYGDGEILEINQVTAYFAYANRTVTGLGATTEGDTLGLSPGDSDDSDDPDNWTHG